MAIIGEWIPQSGYDKKADAHKVSMELESIGYQNGTDEFNTQEVVDFARNNPSSEIHKLLEWNDSIAAEQYRNQQVRDILRYLKITVVKEEEPGVKEPTLTRCFVNTGKRDGTYKKTEIVFQNATEADRILENMKRDAENYINRYRAYAHLNPNLSAAIAALQGVINP